MKKHILKPIILVLLGSVLFTSCSVEYRERGGRYNHRYHDRYHDRDHDRNNDRHYDSHYHDYTH